MVIEYLVHAGGLSACAEEGDLEKCELHYLTESCFVFVYKLGGRGEYNFDLDQNLIN